ncbi:2,3,4,5-tetrahydropyridine-2,6-dicarboxylate N-acetyltransferase [Mycoplasmatota bacterium]|nr:2,3,4,5-tetrahydropyridine-2,6-dicarboxylate N-acetyltransferase [Mycoplasmatota bacterium]
MDATNLIDYIKKQKKRTTVKVYCSGRFDALVIPKDIKGFACSQFVILIGEYEEVQKFINSHQQFIDDYYIEYNHHHTAIPLLKYYETNARIEPGAIIRENVTICDQAVILMGAVINIGAYIGEKTMIDMNAVIGSRAHIGRNCHISAGAVIAGVIEPVSAKGVIIEDNVIVGANSVVLEGVHIHKNAVIGAGCVVCDDVLENAVYVGNKAKFLKYRDELTNKKTIISDDLR